MLSSIEFIDTTPCAAPHWLTSRRQQMATAFLIILIKHDFLCQCDTNTNCDYRLKTLKTYLFIHR